MHCTFSNVLIMMVMMCAPLSFSLSPYSYELLFTMVWLNYAFGFVSKINPGKQA